MVQATRYVQGVASSVTNSIGVLTYPTPNGDAQGTALVDVNGNPLKSDQGGRLYTVATRRPPGRGDLGSVIFVEDGRHPVLGMFNDGLGVAYRDNEVPFMGMPSVRLDPQGTFTTSGSFSITVDSHGVVFKRRIIQNFSTITTNSSGIFRWEGWLRWTSTNNHGSQWTGFSIYDRDGTNTYIGRLWLDPTNNSGNAVQVNYAGSDGAWHALSPVQNTATNIHNYQPDQIGTGGDVMDVAGGWHYVRLDVDMGNKKYVAAQFNENVWDLSSQSTFQTPSSAARMFHFSVEYTPRTNTPRFMNVAQMVATQIG